MHFASGNHRGHAAVHAAINPTQLVLPWRPVASDRVYVAVDQPWAQSSSSRVDHGCGVFGINIFSPADRDDSVIHCNYRVGVQNWLFEITTQQQSDVANHQLV